LKYGWLKKYKNLKIKAIPDLTNDINTYFIMPKHYYDRYLAIKNSDIDSMSEEDLRILLYAILNHEKIKNNRIIRILDRLLEYPDNAMPSTNYNLEEMLDEIRTLKNNEPTEDKLSSNNIAACYKCLQVFYVDKIKYANKKGHCLCPYCKSSTIYFDNDFIPMDENFLRLAKLVHGITPLGCNFKNLQKLVKKSIRIKEEIPKDTKIQDSAILKRAETTDILLEDDHIEFLMEEVNLKKSITSKEEMQLHYILNECFQIIEKNIISKVLIDLSILKKDYTEYLTLMIFLLEALGKNPYLKEITLITKDKETAKIYKSMIKDILGFQKEKI